MKNKKWSLSKLSFLNAVFTTVIISIVFIGITIYEYNEYYTQKIVEVKKAYILKNKALLKEEVSSEIRRINNIVSDFHHSIVSILDDRIETVKNIYLSNTKLHPNIKEKKLISHFFKTLDLLSYKNTKGYVYIFDKNADILYHKNKNLINTNFYNNNFFGKDVLALIKKATDYGTSNGNYTFIDSEGNKKNLYTHIKKVGDIYIAASVYIEEIETEFQQSVLNGLRYKRFGVEQYGYFWIIDGKNTMIFHPLQEELVNQNLTHYKTEKGVFIFKKINDLLAQNSETFVKYNWKIPNKNKYGDKISFIKKVGIWDWRMGAGFYFKDLKQSIKHEEELLKKSFIHFMSRAIIIIFLLSIIILFFAWTISQRFKKVEENQVKHLNLLEQYKMILDKSTIVSKTDTKGRILEVNKLFEEISGFSKKELIGKPHNIIRHPATPKDVFEEMWKIIKRGDIWQGLLRNQCKDKSKSYYNRVTIVPIKDENKNIVEYISAATNVTEIVEQQDKIENLFLTDSLTSLGSRIKLLDVIAESETKNTIALIDIDRFTEINDTYGNKIGDIILREVADNIYEFSQFFDLSVFRIHADVFAVYSEKYAINEFERLIEKLIEEISSKKYYGKYADVNLSFTAGLAHGDCEIMACADMALKNAKKNKKNLVIYDAENSMLDEFEGNFLWMKKLNTAIQDDRIVPFYQPIYNFKTKKIEKYEVLMRYIDEDGTEVSPVNFLEVAKKTKLYPQLTKRIVNKAANYFKDYREVEFSINLTLEDLLNQDTMSYIYSTIKQHKLFKNLVIEIVESEELVSFEHVEEVLKKFKNKGVKIAIDDFGAGYSNYNYLLKLDVDYIKIDGSIINNILKSQATVDIVSSIVDFSQKSGIKTIGEFVSNEELASKIEHLNVDFAQGYFYGKPMKDIS